MLLGVCRLERRDRGVLLNYVCLHARFVTSSGFFRIDMDVRGDGHV